jgi:D-alanyl-D-alanine carboxypeptidase
MNKLFELVDMLDFKKYWKSFLVSLAATFLMASFQHFGVKINIPFYNNLKTQVSALINHNANLINPIPKPVEAIENVRPKLEQKPNSYFLNTPASLITTAKAAGDYDQAKAFVAINYETGEVLAEKNMSEQLPIASLTKVMTAITALDLAKPEDTFAVSEKAQNMIPTKIGVIKNQQLTLEELVNALLLTSANDSAQVIKEGINQKTGSEVFEQAMSEKAKIIGLHNSHFQNPQGFDQENHYSSAEDLAIISHYALENYPLIREIVGKQYQFLPENQNHKQFDLYNWNGLLGVYPGVYGVKIGNTENAGYTTVVVSERDGQKILVVLLGAPGVLERDLWASQLLDLGFGKTIKAKPVNVTKEMLKEKYATWKYWD